MPLKAKFQQWTKESWFDEIEESWIYGVELKPDFSGIIGEPVALLCPPQTMDDPQAEWENRSVTSHEVNRRWTEGSYIVKHKNLYYMLYSANFFGGKLRGGLCYLPDPLRTIHKSCQQSGATKEHRARRIVTGTGHCMLIDIHNRLYCVYHGRTETTGDERMVFIDPAEIQPDRNWWSTDRIPAHSKLSIECSQANTGALRHTVKKLSYRFPIIELN